MYEELIKGMLLWNLRENICPHFSNKHYHDHSLWVWWRNSTLFNCYQNYNDSSLHDTGEVKPCRNNSKYSNSSSTLSPQVFLN